MHTHGDGHTHEPHGGARGFGWELLDSIMLGCFVVIAGLLAEHAYKAWRLHRANRVRYDLTPAGRAATEPEPEQEG